MNAGTRTIRTSVASASTAKVRPSPNIRMNDTCATMRAANEIDITSAAAVITRPVRAIPKTTLSLLSARVRTRPDVVGGTTPEADVVGPATPEADVVGPATPEADVVGPATPEASQNSRMRETRNT